MNLTRRPPYQKGVSRKKSKKPTSKQRKRWSKIATLGCLLKHAVSEVGFECQGRICIHHCFTGAGGRKNHDLVAPLCYEHHQGANGIDGKRMSKRAWQEKYLTEAAMIEKVERLLKIKYPSS